MTSAKPSVKFLFFIASCFVVFCCSAQKRGTYPSADSIMITGLVKKETAVSLKDLSVMPDTSFASLKILNHKGELKTTYRHVKAILLKKLLEDNLVPAEKPKELHSLYFVCKAMDGYTVVYSYSELFYPLADAVFILTAYDNFDINAMPEKPVILNLAGQDSGKLGLKGLKSIDVRKAE